MIADSLVWRSVIINTGDGVVQNVKGLTDQFVWYKNWKAEVLSLVGPEKGNFIISTSLYIFSTGANDWVNNYYLNPVLMKKYNTDEYITFLIGLARGYIQVQPLTTIW